MRVECPACKEVSIAHILEVRERVVCFSCTKCGSHFSHLVARDVEEFGSISDESESGCPKCGYVGSPNASACGQCGLSRENFSSYQASDSKGEKETVATAWKEVEAQWHSDDAHKNFVNSLLADGGFREGAAKYRRAAVVESKRERCEEMMASIQKMAAVALLTSKPKLDEAKEPFGSVMLLLVACFVLAGASVLYAVMRKDDKQSRPSNRQEELQVPGPRLRTTPVKRPSRSATPNTGRPAPRRPASKASASPAQP